MRLWGSSSPSREESSGVPGTHPVTKEVRVLPETWHVPRSPTRCQMHIYWECRKEPMNALCEIPQQQQEQRYNSKPFITLLVISNKVGTKVPFHCEGSS